MYSQIFEKFYDDDEDKVRGLIAYGLYKIAKREWHIQFKGEKGREPNLTEISDYTAMWTQALLDGKRIEANDVMRAYSNTVIDNERPAIVESALRGTWSNTIIKNLASSAIYTLILILLALILKMAGVDILQIAGAVTATKS
jgi:hypothetical protein